MRLSCDLIRRLSCGLASVACVTMVACADSADPLGTPTCEILLDPVVTIGPKAVPAGPTQASQIVRSEGLYFVSGTYNPGQVSVFDSRGELLQTIGTRGRGPGENMVATGISVAGDTVYILDRELLRIQAFRRNGDYAGAAAKLKGQTPFTSLRATPGLVLMRGAGEPGPAILERIEGDSVTATVEISNESTAENAKGQSKLVDVGGSVWVGFQRQYLIERYDYASGKRLDRIAADYPHFTIGRPRSELEKEDSVAALADIAVDGRGRLMVMRIVRRIPQEKTPADRRQTFDTNLWQAIIDVFHPTTHRLLARHIAPQSRLRDFADDSHVYTLTERDDGTTAAEVFRIYVVKPNSREACE